MEEKYPSLLAFVLLCFFFMATSDALNTSTDMEALLSFKSQLSGNKDFLSLWNRSSSVCTWPGITCARGTNRVQSIELPGLGLSGPMPPQLFNLSLLVILDLSDNFFHGQIPQQFATLSHLRVIALYNNSFTGRIPSDLGLLFQLRVLSLSLNSLSGPLPPSLGNLSSLQHLYLERNHFSGSVPEDLGYLQSLLTLQLSENNFVGSIPSSIYNLSSLKELSVVKNMLVGELPPDMGFTSINLTSLHMALNYFSGTIPASFSNLTKIVSLDLSYNRFHGLIPPFPNMPDLVKLNLGNNNFNSTTHHNYLLFASLAHSNRLEILSLPSNNLAGFLPSSVSNLSTHLVEFCVDKNYLSGKFPLGFEKFKNLTVLALHQNQFTGIIPPEIGLLQKLQRLSLHMNEFSGSIPDVFSNFTRLYQLTMGYNQFSGSIPRSIGDCEHLNFLDLAINNFNGSIPREIFLLLGLIQLRLQQNYLSGPLPLEVGNLRQLESLLLSSNELSGEIPATIGDCSNLKVLMMDKNQFRGSLPEALDKIRALESLDLSSNNLSGLIPKSLEKLVFLRRLNLSHNNLHGEIPSEGVFRNLRSDSLLGNSRLCSDDDIIQKLVGVAKCRRDTKKLSLALKISIPVICFALVVSVVSSLAFATLKRKKKKNLDSPEYFKGQPVQISYAEIVTATNGFDSQNLVGKGGSGSIYRGILRSCRGNRNEAESGTLVAIKVMDINRGTACSSFISECEALRNIRHRNLVKMISSCSSIDYKGNEFKALIMEFLPRGSLDKWLYPDGITYSRLCFVRKLKIAIDVASAIDYLHHDCDPPIVHCDLKPSNVLLDEDMTAHVGDFGLARFLQKNRSESCESSRFELQGSIGYIAPEYGLGGGVSAGGDVYSYGILLLEMFMCRKPMEEGFRDHSLKLANLADLNLVAEAVDPLLIQDDDSSASRSTSGDWEIRKSLCLTQAIRLGLNCAAHSATDRPSMREALRKLYEIKESLVEI
ncbi:probable LRR receptor-like serine/threonine-protein kinase At3g47570 [Aristolochia californica]|uniref:probable LRR receptor-like serine/threonine-protein kinase At3g47570 n=1 Tax=Aristolochia californica TaxID=171875 RepID=UPI0035DD1BBC